MKKKNKLLSYIGYAKIMTFWSMLTVSVIVGSCVYAASTSRFYQTINAGTLTVDIVDGNYDSVTNPAVQFTPITFSFNANTSTGVFGSSTERIYVSNPDAADDGWTLSLAGTSTTALWQSGSYYFDFNEPGNVVDDGAGDADAYGGAMTIDPSGATVAEGSCSACTTGNISVGSAATYSEGSVNAITLLTAAAGSDDIGDWVLTDIDVTQTIPAEQAAAENYYIDMVLSIVAS